MLRSIGNIALNLIHTYFSVKRLRGLVVVLAALSVLTFGGCSCRDTRELPRQAAAAQSPDQSVPALQAPQSKPAEPPSPGSRANPSEGANASERSSTTEDAGAGNDQSNSSDPSSAEDMPAGADSAGGRGPGYGKSGGNGAAGATGSRASGDGGSAGGHAAPGAGLGSRNPAGSRSGAGGQNTQSSGGANADFSSNGPSEPPRSRPLPYGGDARKAAAEAEKEFRRAERLAGAGKHGEALAAGIHAWGIANAFSHDPQCRQLAEGFLPKLRDWGVKSGSGTASNKSNKVLVIE